MEPAEVEDLISRWLDVVGGVQPDPFQGGARLSKCHLRLEAEGLWKTTRRGKYPLLDAATFRVRHVDLLIDSPTRYGQVDVSLRGQGAPENR